VPAIVLLSYFVVAPAVTQHLFDRTEISLSNLTQLACAEVNRTQLFNAVELKIPFFFAIKLPTTISSFTQEVYTTGCVDPKNGFQGGFACDSPSEYFLGHYASPQMEVHTGKTNLVNFSAILHNNLTVALDAWTLAFAMNPVGKARLILKAQDISVKLFGIKIVGGFSLHNELTCTARCPKKDGFMSCPNSPVPNSICHPDNPKSDPDSSPALHVSCEFGASNIRPSSTTQPPTSSSPLASMPESVEVAV
jgi:hypothetical protein